MRIRIAFATIAVISALAAGCQCGTPPPNPEPLQSNPLTSIASIANGLSQPLTAIGTYSSDTTAPLTDQATWSSSDPAVATVSNAAGQHGVATGLAVGSTTITATVGGIAGSASISVTAAQL